MKVGAASANGLTVAELQTVEPCADRVWGVEV